MTTSHKQDLKGLLSVYSAAIIWGIGYPFWKILSLKLDVLFLTATSFFITSIILFIYDRHNIVKLISSFKKAPWLIILLGLSAGILGSGLFFLALERLNSGIVAFLEKLQILSVLICARIFLKEQFPLRKIPLVILTLFLALLLTIEDPMNIDIKNLDLVGLSAGFSCAIFYGANVIMYKILASKGISSSEVVFFRMFVGALLILPIILLNQSIMSSIAQVDVSSFFLLFGLCVCTQAFAFKLFVYGLQYTSAATSGFIELLTPIVAMFVGMMFFAEKLSFQQLIVIPAYLICIGLLSLPKKNTI